MMWLPGVRSTESEYFVRSILLFTIFLNICYTIHSNKNKMSEDLCGDIWKDIFELSDGPSQYMLRHTSKNFFSYVQTKNPFPLAFSYGLKIVKLLPKSYFVNDNMVIVAKIGALDVLKFLWKNGFGLTVAVSTAAALHGQLDVLEWCREVGCPWYVHACWQAAEYGHLHILEWMREKGCTLDSVCTRYAVTGGHLNILKWCEQYGTPWELGVCKTAAYHGHLHILQYVREKDYPCDVGTTECAAAGGHLEVLKWRRENGCPWNSNVTMYAANHGHLEVLRWALENGCPCDERASENAANGRLDILKLLRKKGCTINHETRSIAQDKGYHDILVWCRKHNI
jgi:hypothetical protein